MQQGRRCGRHGMFDKCTCSVKQKWRKPQKDIECLLRKRGKIRYGITTSYQECHLLYKCISLHVLCSFHLRTPEMESIKLRWMTQLYQDPCDLVQKNSIYATTIHRYYISLAIMTRLVRLYMFCISDISEAGKKIACKERWLS